MTTRTLITDSDRVYGIFTPADGMPRVNLHNRSMRMFAHYVRSAAAPEAYVSQTHALLGQIAAARYLRDRNKYLEGLCEHIEGGGVDIFLNGVVVVGSDPPSFGLPTFRWHIYTKAICSGEPIDYQAIDAITDDLNIPHMIEVAAARCSNLLGQFAQAALIELLEAVERRAGKEASCQHAG